MVKKRITKRGMCEVYANKIHTEALSEKQILDVLHRIWEVAFTEGWRRKLSEGKDFRARQKALKKKSWDKHKDFIDDVTDGKMTPQNQNQQYE